MTLSSLAIRLQLPTIAAAAAIGLLLVWILATQTFQGDDSRLAEPRAAVDAASAIASAYAREEAAGRLTGAEARKAALAAIGTIRHGANETVWVTDAHPRMIADPAHPQLNGTDLTAVRDPSGRQTYVEIAAAARGGKAGSHAFVRVQPGTAGVAERLACIQWFQPWGWVVASDASTADLPAEASALPPGPLVIAGAGVLAVAGLAAWLSSELIRATRSLTSVAKQLAEGDFTAETVSIGRADEIGDLAQAMELFRRRALERFRVVRAAQDERQARDRRQAEMDQLTRDFGAVFSTLLQRLAATAEKLPPAANEIANLTHESRDATTKTAAAAAAASGALAKAGLATVALASGIEQIGVHAAETTAAARLAAAQAAEARAGMHEIARVFDLAEIVSEDVHGAGSGAYPGVDPAARAGTFALDGGRDGRGDPGGVSGEATDDVRDAATRAAAALRRMDAALATLDAAPEAIAALSSRHTATVRGFAAGVQAVARASDQMAKALAGLESIADRTRMVNRGLLADALTVGRVATTLHDEAQQFFKVIGETDQSRRRFDRVPGHGAIAILAAPGVESVEARLDNISRGGASLRARFIGQTGDEVSVLLPQTRQPVAARIIRCGEDTVAVAFALDDKTMAIVGQAVEALA